MLVHVGRCAEFVQAQEVGCCWPCGRRCCHNVDHVSRCAELDAVYEVTDHVSRCAEFVKVQEVDFHGSWNVSR